jgi:serine/threonine-protein kinase RsbW
MARTPLEAAAGSATRVTRVSLRFPAVLDYRQVAVDLVGALIQQLPRADREFRIAMLTAFGEAFNNIAIHGYGGRPDGMLEVEAEMTPDRMTLRLIDTGRAVDFKKVVPPDLDSVPESGMGVFMIHAFVDEMQYRGGPPNVLTLAKRTASAGGTR